MNRAHTYGLFRITVLRKSRVLFRNLSGSRVPDLLDQDHRAAAGQDLQVLVHEHPVAGVRLQRAGN